MTTREEIDQQHINEANALEAEFFDIVAKGLPNQHRVLKPDKSLDTFNKRHGEIWCNHERELVDTGHRKPRLRPKRYILYTKKITTPRRTVYVGRMNLEDLTPKEIALFKAEGYTVEEV